MIAGSVARRYAKALLQIGIETKTFEGLGREMERLGQAYTQSAELRESLQNPVFPLSARRKVLDELGRRLALSRTSQHVAAMLLSRGRISYLPGIARELRTLVDAHAGRIRAQITTARPLDVAAEVRIKTALERTTGKTIVLDKRVDPALIGGTITQLGDVVYDGSVATQLASIRQQLLGG